MVQRLRRRFVLDRPTPSSPDGRRVQKARVLPCAACSPVSKRLPAATKQLRAQARVRRPFRGKRVFRLKKRSVLGILPVDPNHWARPPRFSVLPPALHGGKVFEGS